MAAEKILIVDDDPGSLSLFSVVLNDAGFSVTTASSGREALKLIAQEKPVVVLQDLMMPEMSGDQVCSAIKQDPSLDDIIVVILSARDDLESRLKCLDAGAEEYLSKPIHPQELILRLQRLVNLRMRLQTATSAQKPVRAEDSDLSVPSDPSYKTLPTVLGLSPAPSNWDAEPASPAGSDDSARKGREKYGNYRVENLAGAGGMGLVYKAYDPALDRYVAVKVLSNVFSGSQEFLNRFQREARLIASVNHPGIAQIYAFGEEDGESYFTLQWCSGGSLAHRIRQLKKFELLPAIDIILQCARALEAANVKGVVHRDIKPSNLMFDQDEHIRIVDFGVASSINKPESGDLGLVVGSPAYMAPEQGQGAATDLRTDIYSLGITFYQMLYGQLPFTAEEPLEWIEKHRSAPFPAYDDQSGKIPSTAYQIIRRMTEKEPAARYEKYSHLIRDLERLRNDLYSEQRLKIPKALNAAPQPSVKSGNFLDLLSYVFRKEVSGLLKLSWGPLQKEFLVARNEIVSFESPLPDESIWKVMVKRKMMTPADIPPKGQDFEESLNRLLFLEIFSPEALKSLYRDVMLESILQVFWWPVLEGEFFEADIQHEPLARIPVARVIMEGARSAAPIEIIQAEVPEDQYVVRTPKFDEILMLLNLQRTESFLASRLEGEHITIQTLEYLTGFSPEIILRTVCGLEKLGALEYRSSVKKQEKPTTQPEEIPSEKKELTPEDVFFGMKKTDKIVFSDSAEEVRLSSAWKAAEKYFRVARQKYEAEQYWEAQRQCVQAILNDPEEAKYHHLMALSLSHFEHSLKAAEESFRQAILLDPKNTDYRLDLALFLKKCGRLDQAIGECFGLMELSPGHPQAKQLMEEIEASRA